jgi:hypothetical protein
VSAAPVLGGLWSRRGHQRKPHDTVWAVPSTKRNRDAVSAESTRVESPVSCVEVQVRVIALRYPQPAFVGRLLAPVGRPYFSLIFPPPKLNFCRFNRPTGQFLRFPSEIPHVPAYRHITCSTPQTRLVFAVSSRKVRTTTPDKPRHLTTYLLTSYPSLYNLLCVTQSGRPCTLFIPLRATTCLSPVRCKEKYTHLVEHTVPLSHTTSSDIPGRRMCVSLRGSPKPFHMYPLKQHRDGEMCL